MKIAMIAHLRLLVAAASLFTMREAAAAVITLSTADRSARGWYDISGYHRSDNDNYLVGAYDDGPYRNFFVFILPALQPGQSIVSASLILHCPVPGGYNSSDPSETYQMFALENTTIASLQMGGDGLIGIYSDLGEGTAYSAGVMLTAASMGTDVSIPLNQAFLDYAGMHSGEAIALGGALISAADGGNCFSGTGGLNDSTLDQTRLSVTVVPEPSVALLLGAIAAIPLGRGWNRRIQCCHEVG